MYLLRLEIVEEAKENFEKIRRSFKELRSDGIVLESSKKRKELGVNLRKNMMLELERHISYLVGLFHRLIFNKLFIKHIKQNIKHIKLKLRILEIVKHS